MVTAIILKTVRDDSFEIAWLRTELPHPTQRTDKCLIKYQLKEKELSENENYLKV
ncbi:MAG: hypothetical protein WA364_23200 [Candidatus Nitrosopolaris sp.]